MSLIFKLIRFYFIIKRGKEYFGERLKYVQGRIDSKDKNKCSLIKQNYVIKYDLKVLYL